MHVEIVTIVLYLLDIFLYKNVTLSCIINSVTGGKQIIGGKYNGYL